MKRLIAAVFLLFPITGMALAADDTSPLAITAPSAYAHAPAQPSPVVAQPAPIASTTPAQLEESFIIMAGDVLQITVWKEDSLDKEVVVLQDDTITFPLIGTVQVRGLTPTALENTIKQRLENFIPDAAVSVMVKAPLGHTVSVIGQVAKPGEIVLSRPIGVMEALSQVGGLTPYADTSNIVVLRYVDGKKTSLEFPYKAIAKGRHLEKDITLKAKDVVVVPTGGLF